MNLKFKFTKNGATFLVFGWIPENPKNNFALGNFHLVSDLTFRCSTRDPWAQKCNRRR